CSSCKSITLGNNLDITEIDAASNTGVDNVRENIIASARIAPQTKYKVFIIDEVHMLSISAFNALLKIIEEPPAKVIFILCTTEIHKVPATIISRCERFDFKRISVAEVVKKLNFIASSEKIEIESSVLEAVARQANGYMRDAESLLGQIMALGDKKISAAQAELVIPNYNSQEIIDLLDYISKKDAAKAIRLINNLVDSGLNVKNFTSEIITILRKIIFNKINPSLASSLGLDFGEGLEVKVSDLSEQLNLEQWIFITQEFLSVYNSNSNIFITQLPLELVIINICNSDQSKPTKPTSSLDSSRLPKRNSPAGDETTTRAVLNLSFLELRDKWPEFLIKIKKYNHSLSFVLQNCQAKEVKDNKLCLAFKYKFHKDRINDPQVRNIVEETLLEVFGSALEIEALIDENLTISQEVLREQIGAAGGLTDGAEVAASEPEGKTAATNDSKKTDLLGNLLQAFGGEVIN
ncbi:MAG: DNA polymerase III subunit gamma/tau, partial [Candidatus Falkowbacteria bacterium]|nr:DNA polymerase III subunit gamma/tau [Candidatus Falkowbacteria bacterium]